MSVEYKKVEPQPQVYDVDIMKCKDLKELKKIVSVFHIQMTEEYAKQEGLSHLLIKPEQPQVKLPKLTKID